MDDIQIQIESEIRKCNVEEMCRIAEGIKVPEDQWRGKSKVVVSRSITSALDELPDDEQRREVMKQMLPLVPDRISKSMMAILQLNIEEKDGKEDTGDHQMGMQDTLMLLQSLGIDANSSSKFRREFKIIGIIGDDSKDSLNYISLCSQINDGKKKGYKEEEIAMSVRKAISPGSNLRTYLDSKTDITLDAMLPFIRSALREKSATELYQDLNNAYQLDTEDAQKFVLRAMELREKVLLASKAEGSIRYDEELVQALFLHTVRTGLQDDSIKARIEPLVRKGVFTPDETLIQELNLVTSEEAERKSKRGLSGKTKLQVAEANVSTSNPLLDTVKEMSEQIKSRKKDIDELKNRSAPKRFTRKKGCDHCAKQDRGDACRHCYRCGAGDHMMRDCKKQSSLNY